MSDNNVEHTGKVIYDQIATLYDQGRYKESFELAYDLSVNGSYNAQKFLAFLYLKGEGVECDIKKARYWFKKIQDADNSGEADYYLGYIFFIDNDYLNASKLYEQAIRKGFLPTYSRLGILYWKGKGVKKDQKKAFELVSTAADKGSLVAMRNKSGMLLSGIDGARGIVAGLTMLFYSIFKFIIIYIINKDDKRVRY